MTNRRQFLLGMTSALALAACAKDQPIPGPVPQIGFAHLAPLQFRVQRVDVSSAYKSPLAAPNAEHRMPTPPERAMFDWALARLKAAGGADVPAVATFTVEDAKVIETKLQKSGGLKNMFTYQPSERYDARAAASLTIADPASGAGGSLRVIAQRSIEVPENATLAEREQAWLELVEKLMADFNGQMESQIAAHLGPWLVR